MVVEPEVSGGISKAADFDTRSLYAPPTVTGCIFRMVASPPGRTGSGLRIAREGARQDRALFGAAVQINVEPALRIRLFLMLGLVLPSG